MAPRSGPASAPPQPSRLLGLILRRVPAGVLQRCVGIERRAPAALRQHGVCEVLGAPRGVLQPPALPDGGPAEGDTQDGPGGPSILASRLGRGGCARCPGLGPGRQGPQSRARGAASGCQTPLAPSSRGSRPAPLLAAPPAQPGSAFLTPNPAQLADVPSAGLLLSPPPSLRGLKCFCSSKTLVVR